MVLNQTRQKYNRKFRGGLWLVAIAFPIVFGYLTTVDAGMFMAIVSLLVTLVLSQVLFNDVKVRAQGGAEDTSNSDLAGDEIA
ncbi:hypothetical protein [Halomontanus rarus]|uniref:hypothetical protein n=1 Tax=Halomontanus rarus TaxID=3034020 RepID=UPI0023E8BA6B|nr:hypothetical protein [Halovivax sp. TS33]